jgi:hypothetical protein
VSGGGELVRRPGNRGSSAIRLFSTQGQKTPNQRQPNHFVYPHMAKSDQAKAREQRLAVKLRENLKRRKGQARARGESQDEAAPAGAGVSPAGKDKA